MRNHHGNLRIENILKVLLNTINYCGILWFNGKHISWAVYLYCWLQRLFLSSDFHEFNKWSDSGIWQFWFHAQNRPYIIKSGAMNNFVMKLLKTMIDIRVWCYFTKSYFVLTLIQTSEARMWCALIATYKHLWQWSLSPSSCWCKEFTHFRYKFTVEFGILQRERRYLETYNFAQIWLISFSKQCWCNLLYTSNSRNSQWSYGVHSIAIR